MKNLENLTKPFFYNNLKKIQNNTKIKQEGVNTVNKKSEEDNLFPFNNNYKKIKKNTVNF